MWVNPVGRFDHLLGTKAGMACIHFFGSEHTSLQTIHVLHLVIKPDVSHHEAGKTPFEVASENTKPKLTKDTKILFKFKTLPLQSSAWQVLDVLESRVVLLLCGYTQVCASFPSQQICLLAISPGSPGLSHTPRF